jgi:UDP-N-acetylglucosamine 2-epimerase (non-hydrolysing)
MKSPISSHRTSKTVSAVDLPRGQNAANSQSVISSRKSLKRTDNALTGNTVIDALIAAIEIPCDLKKAGVSLKRGKKTILVTMHRRESLGMPMKNVCEAIVKIAKKYSDRVSIIIPVHKNPVVRDIVESTLGDQNEVQLIEPLDYIPFVHLMKEADIILTDSGGIQEEAPSLGKPVLVLRQVTERPEAVLANTVKVVGTDKDAIFKETERLNDLYLKEFSNMINKPMDQLKKDMERNYFMSEIGRAHV